MKKVFLLLFGLSSLCSFSQSINEYEFFTVPTKFEFQDSENEYRINTILKFRLEEYGFKVSFISNELRTNYMDRCLYLNAVVVNESNAFLTKFHVVFKDCNNAVIFKSDVGTSKLKVRKEGAAEALENALKSVKALNYKFTGKNTEIVKMVDESDQVVEVQKTELSVVRTLFAQPILNGYQLIDATPKIILKIFKTSKADYFTATSETNTGVIFKKNNMWIFEYYKEDKLISEELTIKF
jgi:hypothetical protein